MEEIGGYFELSLPKSKQNLFGNNAIYLNSGRNALEYILKSISNLRTVWLPYFTCSSIREIFLRIDNIQIKYYHVNSRLEIDDIHLDSLSSDEFLVYTNYFGIKNNYVETLQAKGYSNLIFDFSQSLFCKPTDFCFFSPRKFIGLPDGGIAFSKFSIDVTDCDLDSYTRCNHLLRRFDYLASDSYLDFKKASASISNQSLKQMSNLTRNIFETCDLNSIREIRNKNFNYIHSNLGHLNQYDLSNECIDGPLVYPLINDKSEFLRKKLIENKVYVASYWPNIFDEMHSSSVEYNLSNNILALPIDQRYSENEMDRVINLIALYQ